MKEKGMNVTEAMYEVGYSNYSYFSRRFSDVNGISPREVLGMKK
jgi:AraC-like DNA-binding protein